MTEQLNYIGQAINLARRATGTRTSPGETCEHIRFTNPDRELKDGRLKLFGCQPFLFRRYKRFSCSSQLNMKFLQLLSKERKLNNKSK